MYSGTPTSLRHGQILRLSVAKLYSQGFRRIQSHNASPSNRTHATYHTKQRTPSITIQYALSKFRPIAWWHSNETIFSPTALAGKTPVPVPPAAHSPQTVSSQNETCWKKTKTSLAALFGAGCTSRVLYRWNSVNQQRFHSQRCAQAHCRLNGMQATGAKFFRNWMDTPCGS